MAELFKFADALRSPDDRARPIKARNLDENFTQCRTEIAQSLASLLKISQEYPKSDKIDLAASPSGTFIPIVQNGSLILFEVPTSGVYYIKFTNGTPEVIERGSCEE